MNKFYESVVLYDKLNEEGEAKIVKEQFVFTGKDIADVETKTLKEVIPFKLTFSDVQNIKVSKYTEFISENAEISKTTGKTTTRYYGVKVSFITIDEAKNKEKLTAYHYLVEAVSNEAAGRTVKQFMSDAIVDYKINNIIETKIADVILS